MRGGAFLNGKEGRVGFRKNPFLMGKSDANECNESSLSNCRVQLALSTKKDGMRQIIDYYHVVCDFYKVYQKSSKITPSLFFDKASCTRQFESELSLHSLASLFPLKEGSTSHPDPLTLRGEGGNRPTRCCDLDF